MGDYFVSWGLDGGFYWVLFYYGVTLYLGCLLEGFYCILGFMWVLGVVGMQFLMGFSCGLARLLLCILIVYLGASYAFLIKFSYL
jgi:hypothetical protein